MSLNVFYITCLPLIVDQNYLVNLFNEIEVSNGYKFSDYVDKITVLRNANGISNYSRVVMKDVKNLKYTSYLENTRIANVKISIIYNNPAIHNSLNNTSNSESNSTLVIKNIPENWIEYNIKSYISKRFRVDPPITIVIDKALDNSYFAYMKFADAATVELILNMTNDGYVDDDELSTKIIPTNESAINENASKLPVEYLNNIINVPVAFQRLHNIGISDKKEEVANRFNRLIAKLSNKKT